MPLSFGLLLGATLTAVYWREQLTLLTAILIGGSAVGLVVTWDVLRSRRLLATTLLVNVALVLLYFWSLDESHHVELRVTPAGFVATVDGDTLHLPIAPLGGQFGLQTSPLLSYRVQATGEALQTDTQSLFARIAATTRLAQPASAWANLRVRSAGSTRFDPNVLRLEAVAGSWSTNRRSELQGSPSGYLLFAPVRASSYVISVDVRRPDGTQNILVDLDRHGVGYALELRFDQPDMIWTTWRNGEASPGLESTRLRHLAFIPELQRVTRVVLTGYLFALLFAALAIGLYPILLLAFRLLPGRSRDEWTTLAKVLHWRWFAWAVFALVGAIALVLTTLVSSDLLDRIPHVQDSVAYLFQAKILAGGAFNVRPPPAAVQSFFSEQFVPMFHGKWFAQYPPGHSVMLMLGVLAGAPWLVGPLLASLSLGCIFLLGRRLYGAGVGLLAALLGLASPLWLFLGSEFMSHSTGLFFAATFLICFARADGEDASPVWPLLAGFLAAMLFITRELTAVGVVGPFVLYVILFRRQMWRRRLLPALGGAAVPLGFMLFYNWIQMGSPFTSTYLAWDRSFGIGFGHSPANNGDFTPADGVWNAYQNLSMLLPQLYGWPYGVALALAFSPFILGAARRWDYLLLASFAGLVIAHAFYWAPGLMYGPRYYYEALPSLLLLTSRGAFELARLPCRIWPTFRLTRDREIGVLFPAALLLSLVIFSLRFYLPAQLSLYHNYNYSSGAELRAVEKARIHHAIVFVVTDSFVGWASYGNVFFANDPSLQGDVIYARDEGPNNFRLYRYFPGRAHYRLFDTKLTRIT